MEPKGIAIRLTALDSPIEPDEVEVLFNQKVKYTPDILRGFSHFLSVADFL